MRMPSERLSGYKSKKKINKNSKLNKRSKKKLHTKLNRKNKSKNKIFKQKGGTMTVEFRDLSKETGSWPNKKKK